MALSFAKKQFPSATILMAVRWYVAYKLSYRDIEELLAERGLMLITRLFIAGCWNMLLCWKLFFVTDGKKRAVSGSWRMDETYIKVKGLWFYLYLVVNKYGDTIDLMLNESGMKLLPETSLTKLSGSTACQRRWLSMRVIVTGRSGSPVWPII